MSDKTSTPPGFSLKRWSQRKAEAAGAVPVVPPALAVPGTASVPDPTAGASAAPKTPAAPAAPKAPAAPLPPVESLTIDSDFTPFFEPTVDEGLRRQALRQLFRDPRFNVMDGLDTYIDDYSIPDPISPEIVRQLVQGRYIFDPPKTRVNEQGVVEDVPADEEAVDGAAPTPGALPEAPAMSSVPAPDAVGEAALEPADPVPSAGPKAPPK